MKNVKHNLSNYTLNYVSVAFTSSEINKKKLETPDLLREMRKNRLSNH